MMKLMHVVAATTAALLLAACGGGNDSAEDSPPPQAVNEVPDSATSTITSYTEYIGSLVLSETDAPKDISKVTPPTSETAAPMTVI
jgi:ABC-type glycerol-3-phosphate transport system substrate-binding protein